VRISGSITIAINGSIDATLAVSKSAENRLTATTPYKPLRLEEGRIK
jgi:hypothetical protein